MAAFQNCSTVDIEAPQQDEFNKRLLKPAKATGLNQSSLLFHTAGGMIQQFNNM